MNAFQFTKPSKNLNPKFIKAQNPSKYNKEQKLAKIPLKIRKNATLN
jgi:hypothetical protein